MPQLVPRYGLPVFARGRPHFRFFPVPYRAPRDKAELDDTGGESETPRQLCRTTSGAAPARDTGSLSLSSRRPRSARSQTQRGERARWPSKQGCIACHQVAMLHARQHASMLRGGRAGGATWAPARCAGLAAGAAFLSLVPRYFNIYTKY